MKKRITFITILSVITLIMLMNFTTLINAEKLWEANPPIHVKKAASITPIGMTPSQIRNAYGINNLAANGTGKTVAIVDAYGSPTISTDLAAFCKQYNLPAADLTIAYPTGKVSQKNAGWALEASLDVEWVHALAPGAKILLVVSKSATTNDLITAIDYATKNAQVVSNSWGGSEFRAESTYDTHFNNQGVVYVTSSGDSGAGAEWPASSPYVVAVGGTTLQIDASGNYLNETAWSGSGGGTSIYEAIPTYQGNWASIAGTKRGIPDISFDADPNSGVAVYDSTPYNRQSGWFQVGGTSLSAPCWAAIIAMLDQNASKNYSSAEFLMKLYSVAGATANNTGYKNDFHDITSGNNGGYTTLSGYDLVTGIGSPKTGNLIIDMMK